MEDGLVTIRLVQDQQDRQLGSPRRGECPLGMVKLGFGPAQGLAHDVLRKHVAIDVLEGRQAVLGQQPVDLQQVLRGWPRCCRLSIASRWAAATRLGIAFGCALELDRPSRFRQQLFRLGRAGERVNDPAVRRAEIARHVAAIFLEVAELIDDLEAADLLMRRHEVARRSNARRWGLTGARPVCLGVVSGESRVFKVARDVNQEDELPFALGLLGGFRGRFCPGECAVLSERLTAQNASGCLRTTRVRRSRAPRARTRVFSEE